jgi:hypothetical protein
MDYLVIGSNGFAQVGSQDFHEKNKIEMKVLLEYLRNNHTIPEEFWHICAYRVKWFNHDFGRYSEIVLVYDDYILDQWEEDNPDKFDRFWNWFNGVEGVDLESESINQAIRDAYEKTIQYQPFQK